MKKTPPRNTWWKVIQCWTLVLCFAGGVILSEIYMPEYTEHKIALDKYWCDNNRSCPKVGSNLYDLSLKTLTKQERENAK